MLYTTIYLIIAQTFKYELITATKSACILAINQFIILVWFTSFDIFFQNTLIVHSIIIQITIWTIFFTIFLILSLTTSDFFKTYSLSAYKLRITLSAIIDSIFIVYFGFITTSSILFFYAFALIFPMRYLACFTKLFFFPFNSYLI